MFRERILLGFFVFCIGSFGVRSEEGEEDLGRFGILGMKFYLVGVEEF